MLQHTLLFGPIIILCDDFLCIDHFTVVGLVTCPLNGSEAVAFDLVLIETSLFYCANQVVHMLTS